MDKRDRWTEQEIDELPPGEHDYFERKSGQLFDKNRGEFLDTIAKAISAFANSGGGHLILGIKDDGTPGGLSPQIGNTSIKDWLEQKLPNLLDYPLSDFRVHLVERATPSRIPPDREVVVVDIGDSALAPHQSAQDKKYYHRSAGRSEPAPHFYLELLRQRLTNPTLEFSLTDLEMVDAYKEDDGIFLETKLKFLVENTGRIAAYKWGLFIRSIQNMPDGREDDYRFGTRDFPRRGPRHRMVRVDDTILPGGTLNEDWDVGFLLRPRMSHFLLAEVEQMIVNVALECQLATETSPGQLKLVELRAVADAHKTRGFVESHVQS